MSYAVIESCGKQHRVSVGDVVTLEKLTAEVGQDFTFDRVLMRHDGDDIQLGSPMLDGVSVKATIVEHGRAKKINIIKFKRRKHHIKRMGHRQWFTKVKIEAIN